MVNGDVISDKRFNLFGAVISCEWNVKLSTQHLADIWDMMITNSSWCHHVQDRSDTAFDYYSGHCQNITWITELVIIIINNLSETDEHTLDAF